MAKWIFKKEDLERVVAQSPNPREELHIRHSMVRFMRETGISLKLAMPTIATAALFYQRYFALRSVLCAERVTMAVTALFLATKVDDAPRKLIDVVRVAIRIYEGHDVRSDSAEAAGFREKVLANELELLKHLGFDLTVELPYVHLKKYLTRLTIASASGGQQQQQQQTDASAEGGEGGGGGGGGDKALGQSAWNFINDSLSTTLLLRYDATILAIAALYLAHKRAHKMFTIPGDKPWWEVFGVDIAVVEQIVNEILQIYEKPTASPSAAVVTVTAMSPSPSSPVKAPVPVSVSSPVAVTVAVAAPTAVVTAQPQPPPKSISPRPRPPIPASDERDRQRQKEERPLQTTTTSTTTTTTTTSTAPVAPLAPVLIADIEMKERSTSRDQSRERFHRREEEHRRREREKSMEVDPPSGAVHRSSKDDHGHRSHSRHKHDSHEHRRSHGVGETSSTHHHHHHEHDERYHPYH